MASEFDQSDFIDIEFLSGRSSSAATASATMSTRPSNPSNPLPTRPPTREELEAKVSDTQQRLAELKRAQEALERERASLEEARRRAAEFQTGREEMIQHLTRGMGLLQEAEFAARRDAEQMSKTLIGFREALDKVQDLHPDTWTSDNYNAELTRALTAVENARMEWNSARLKWPLLDGPPSAEPNRSGPAPLRLQSLIAETSFRDLCLLGLALTWPVALAAVLIVVLLLLR